MLRRRPVQKKEVAEAKLALANASIHRAKCRKSLKAAQKELPGLVYTHKTYVDELRRATKAREEEHKKFLERKSDYEEAIAFLNDFIKYVSQKLKGHYKAFSFVQYSENLLQHATKLGAISAAAPALVAIAEATYSESPKAHDYEFQPNEVLGAKLKRILDDLRSLMIKDHKLNETEEHTALTIFNKYKNRLQRVINTLDKNIKLVKKQIIDMQRCVDTEGKIMASASNKFSRNDNLRNNALRMCASFNNEFIEATLNRLNEIKTMNDILAIVARRFQNLPKSLIAYLEDVKDGWKKYINSTQFQKFVEYQRKQFLRNKRGEELTKGKHLLK